MNLLSLVCLPEIFYNKKSDGIANQRGQGKSTEIKAVFLPRTWSAGTCGGQTIIPSLNVMIRLSELWLSSPSSRTVSGHGPKTADAKSWG